MKRHMVQYLNMTYLLTTTNQRRAALWDRIFGTDALPVLHDAARLQEVGQDGEGVKWRLV